MSVLVWALGLTLAREPQVLKCPTSHILAFEPAAVRADLLPGRYLCLPRFVLIAPEAK